jgi:hypothetical protein
MQCPPSWRKFVAAVEITQVISAEKSPIRTTYLPSKTIKSIKSLYPTLLKVIRLL